MYVHADGWMGGWMVGWMDGWIDKIETNIKYIHPSIHNK